MSVGSVMETMIQQDATESMGASIGNTGAGTQPAGKAVNGTPVVGGIDDIFNLYDSSGDQQESDNKISLKEDKTKLPDELNNVKEVKKEEKPEEVEKKQDEVVKEEAQPVKEERKLDLSEKVKVKVNGNELEVPLQDVINSYSGQQEIQRRFTEFDKQKKTWEKETAQERGFADYVKTEMSELKGSLDGLVRQYEKQGYMEKNPLEVINQLLDKMGINSNLFEKAVFEHQLPEYANFFNMTDVERDALFTKKENEYLRRKEQGFTERDQQVKLREQKQQQDFELIRSAGLDTVKYEELSSELLEAGHTDIDASKVVEYAKQKPTLEKVIKVFQDAGLDATSDPRSKQVFGIFRDHPETTIDEVLEYLDPNRAAIKSAKVLQEKQPKNTRVPPQSNDDDELLEQLEFFRR